MQLKWAAFFKIKTNSRLERQMPNEDDETCKSKCLRVCKTKYKFRNEVFELCGIMADGAMLPCEATLIWTEMEMVF